MLISKRRHQKKNCEKAVRLELSLQLISRTQIHKVCSVWPLNLDWDVVVFLNFRFSIFLEIRFVFCLNMHFLNFTNWFNIWSSGGITCIAWFKSSLPGCVTAFPHCVGMPYWHYQLLLSWYLHQPESHQLSLHNWLSEFETTRPIDLTRDTWAR